MSLFKRGDEEERRRQNFSQRGMGDGRNQNKHKLQKLPE
jgi:hypothetical protein